MNVSIYDPAAARDLFELRQYIRVTISQTRPADMANRLEMIDVWLDRIAFENKESFRTALGVLRSNLGACPDASRIRLCASMLELLLQALPADAC